MDAHDIRMHVIMIFGILSSADGSETIRTGLFGILVFVVQDSRWLRLLEWHRVLPHHLALSVRYYAAYEYER